MTMRSARFPMLALAALLLPVTIDAAEPVASTGEALYRRYCASCHGVTGRGDGPVADALVARPTDLTRLRSEVPDLMQQIDGRRTIRAHGTAAMPVWGYVFEHARRGEPHKGRSSLLEVQVLAEHVRNLQRLSAE
jgi:mono/diheme cytochrome c family protein